MFTREDFSDRFEEMRTWRRDFHMYPELGLREFRTSAKIKEILESFGVEVVSGFCETAVIGVIRGKREHPVIGIRADMDALAMQDEKDVPYRSRNDGVTHACGHDGHVALGLEICRYLQEHKNELNGTVKLFFQPAEEGPTSGARLIIESGAIDDVDVMLGYHLGSSPIGNVTVCESVQNGSGDNFAITIEGEGAHAAYPQKSTDPIITCMDIIAAFQQIISREIDPNQPAVLSVSYINAGSPSACNVISSKAIFGGTVRTVDSETRNYIYKRIKEIGEGICAVRHSKFMMDWEQVSPVLQNDPEIARLFKRCAELVVGAERVSLLTHAEMGYDDFAFYAEKKPAAFLEFGSGHPAGTERYFNHNPKFDIDESGLLVGLAIMLNAVYTYFAEH